MKPSPGKLLAVIAGCKTIDQIKVANRYRSAWLKMNGNSLAAVSRQLLYDRLDRLQGRIK